MIEGKNARGANWLPFVVVVIAAAVLLFASGGDKEKKEKADEGPAAGEMSSLEADQGGEKPSSAGPVEISGMHRVVLAEGFGSWAPQGQLRDDLTLSRSLEVKGKLARASLGVRASVDGRALNAFESVYFKLNYDGGHLFRPASLIPSDAEDATVMLFDLSSLPHLPSIPYDESRAPERADLLKLLEDGRRPLATAFISSLKKGEIEELTLYYECAEGSDCSVSLR